MITVVGLTIASPLGYLSKKTNDITIIDGNSFAILNWCREKNLTGSFRDDTIVKNI